MPASVIGLIFGAALGFAGAFGGFTAFIIVLVVAAAGLLRWDPHRPGYERTCVSQRQ